MMLYLADTKIVHGELAQSCKYAIMWLLTVYETE